MHRLVHFLDSFLSPLQTPLTIAKMFSAFTMTTAIRQKNARGCVGALPQVMKDEIRAASPVLSKTRPSRGTPCPGSASGLDATTVQLSFLPLISMPARLAANQHLATFYTLQGILPCSGHQHVFEWPRALHCRKTHVTERNEEACVHFCAALLLM